MMMFIIIIIIIIHASFQVSFVIMFCNFKCFSNKVTWPWKMFHLSDIFDLNFVRIEKCLWFSQDCIWPGITVIVSACPFLATAL